MLLNGSFVNNLILSRLGKNFSKWHFEIFFLLRKKGKQVVSLNLHESSNPIFSGKKFNLLTAEFVQRLLKGNKCKVYKIVTIIITSKK